jgi:phosphoribosylformylglycinamidine synthase
MPYSVQIRKCKRGVSNAIRAMMESDENPIISIHDHGAGGHLNCLSELVEASGGKDRDG